MFSLLMIEELYRDMQYDEAKEFAIICQSELSKSMISFTLNRYDTTNPESDSAVTKINNLAGKKLKSYNLIGFIFLPAITSASCLALNEKDEAWNSIMHFVQNLKEFESFDVFRLSTYYSCCANAVILSTSVNLNHTLRAYYCFAGETLFGLKDYVNSFYCMQMSLGLSLSLEEEDDITALMYQGIFECLTCLNCYEEAITYVALHSSHEWKKIQTNRYITAASTLVNLAGVLMRSQDFNKFEEAMKILKIAFGELKNSGYCMDEEIRDKKVKIFTYMAECHLQLGNINKCAENLGQALLIRQHISHTFDQDVGTDNQNAIDRNVSEDCAEAIDDPEKPSCSTWTQFNRPG